MSQYTIKPAQAQGYDPADVLHDLSNSGRENPWAELKLQTSIMSTVLQLIDPEAGKRMSLCADTLFFRTPANGHRMTLDSAKFCRARLCPICQWRRALKYAGQAYKVTQYLARQRAEQHSKPYSWIMMTFTLRNVPGKELSAGLNMITDGWRKMSRTKAWKQAIRGSMRSIEITYNNSRNDYHHHMHVMAAVLPSYFSSRYYIAQDQWRTMWREACGVNYDPQCEVHKVRQRGAANIEGMLWAAIAETMKYTCKTSNMIDPSDIEKSVKIIEYLYLASRGRRFAGFTGCVKEARKALKMDDVEEGDLLHVNDDLSGDEADAIIPYTWYMGPRVYLKPSAKKGG